jgi:molybdenum cofactor biosynthesis protein B
LASPYGADDKTPDDERRRMGDAGHTGDGASHDHHRDDLDALGVAVLTVTSSRSLADDPAGDAFEAAVKAESHEMVAREVVRDDRAAVEGRVVDLVGNDTVDTIVTAGGTGVTPDDVTVEAVAPLFDKDLPGFGELFRRQSHDEVGTRVIGTRATAGIVAGVPIFCLPGSENAARLGAELVLAEAPHLAGLAGRDD